MNKRIIFLLLAVGFIFGTAQAQTGTAYKLESRIEGGYTYQTVTGDPLGARFYKLPNGLTIILSVNKAEPRLFTAIAVKAGSKFDPADNTGLAHYLEHMLFKGTDKYGSLDYSQEKVYLNQIESLYDQYNKERDEQKRNGIYAKIDSVSSIAARFAIPNEYDKMLSTLGANATNAFTSDEMTVYVNDIPSNEVDRWLTIEAERFRAPQLRLFHTELEAVYEEKNISLDNDARRAGEELDKNLFPTHPYGTQTTIGTVEHLKNPSLKKIKAYFDKYYVPNNMAIVLAGDFDPTAVVKLIEKHFGSYATKPIAPFTFTPEKPLAGPVERTVSGPDRESVQIGFRLPSKNDPDMVALQLIDLLMANGEVGLIDLDLNQAQKVLRASAYVNDQIDYSSYVLNGQPREGQRLEEVRDLLMAEVDKLKKGEFDYALVPAIIKNQKIQRLKGWENNRNRAYSLMFEFVTGSSWTTYLERLDAMSKLSKDQIVAVAKKYLDKKNTVVVFKRTGPKDQIVKIDKPKITPVELNRTQQSPFVQGILGKAPEPIAPVFLDFQTDMRQSTIGKLPFLYVKNTENELFSLYYHFDMGSAHDKTLPLAIDYLDYLGTDKYTAEEVKKKFYALGCSFGVSTSEDQTYVYLTGLQESFEPAVALFEELLATAKPNPEVYQELVAGILKKRQNAKKDKGVILNQALRNYAIYGPKSPFTNILSETELKALDPKKLTDIIHALTTFPHKVMYYGPLDDRTIAPVIERLHPVRSDFRAIPTRTEFQRLETPANKVLMVDYDMVQAQIVWLHKVGMDYNPAYAPLVAMYNEYFGGNMSSIVFQTIRESKALAYSTYSRFLVPERKEDPYYNLAYVGTQADKMLEAYTAMTELLTDLPLSDVGFETARKSLLGYLSTERVIREDILFSYLNYRRLGLERDLRQDIFNKTQSIIFGEVNDFQGKFVKGQPHTLLLLGSKSRLKPEHLEKMGEVEMLSLEQVFGY
jgi:predicted Zn-dependent peptidase